MTSVGSGDRPNALAALGEYVQARTACELTYWWAWQAVGDADLSDVAVVGEGRDCLCKHEATLRFDPYSIPAKSVVRVNLLRSLD